jgi:hypothetical protein
MIRHLSLFVRMMRLKVVVTLWTFLLIGLARHTTQLTSLCVFGIEWMLVRLSRTDDERSEQICVGIAARAGNGVLLATLAVLILRGQSADDRTLVTIVGCLIAVFVVSFLDAALHPERVRIGYKA